MGTQDLSLESARFDLSSLSKKVQHDVLAGKLPFY